MRRSVHNSSRSSRSVSAVSTSSGENGSSSSSMSGFDDERAGEADALPHAARQFLRIGVLEAVEADQVDRADRAPPPLGGRHAERLEAEFDIAEHGQPRKQREALEHHRDAAHRPGDRLAAILDAALARRRPARRGCAGRSTCRIRTCRASRRSRPRAARKSTWSSTSRPRWSRRAVGLADPTARSSGAIAAAAARRSASIIQSCPSIEPQALRGES